jgi:hypothetical protein
MSYGPPGNGSSDKGLCLAAKRLLHIQEIGGCRELEAPNFICEMTT